MKYPVKSNWIYYKRNRRTGKYKLTNCLFGESYEVEQSDIEFLESLNGKVDPRKILINEYGMTRQEADHYVDVLVENGIVRTSNKIKTGRFSSLITLIKIKNCDKYRTAAIVLLLLFLLAFIPLMCIGFISGRKMLNMPLQAEENIVFHVCLGVFIGLIVGIILHEAAHAVSAIAFGGKVMEFGIAFGGLPSLYTLIDDTTIKSRTGRIITNLAGIMTNFMITAGCLIISVAVGRFTFLLFMAAVLNLGLGLMNLLCIDGFDGIITLAEILGKDDARKQYQEIIKRRWKRKTRDKSEKKKAELAVAYIFSTTRICYPILILCTVCIIMGW